MGENVQPDRGGGTRISQPKCSSDQQTSTPSVVPQSQQATSRFADYFVICGLDLDTGLEADRFAGKYDVRSLRKNFGLILFSARWSSDRAIT